MPKATDHQIDLYNSLQGQFKKIENYTDDELKAVIAVLASTLPEAYKYLNFIDAYFEQRRRKLGIEAAR